MKDKFNFKDVIYIVTLIVALAGTWFTLKGKVDIIEIQVKENTTVLKDNNLELINYKLDKILDILDKK